MNIILIATAWGPKFGGINAFNMDFAKGLASHLGQNGKVFCGVLNATDTEVSAAQNDANVTLLSINKQSNENEFDSDSANDFYVKFQDHVPGGTLDYWVGHDVISGDVAISGAILTGVKSALIMHMNYEAYQGFKSGVSKDAQNKTNSQKQTFKKADILFANGPYLQQVLSRLVNRQVTQLVPGFANITPQPITTEIRAITFGRLDQGNDKIKQGSLAVAGFASAIKVLIESSTTSPSLKNMPKLIKMFGISASDGSEEKYYKQICQERAGRRINFFSLPYDDDREAIFSELAQANIALMVSWHEGFGLTGWESIAAEVPLVLSKESGLWRLIKEQFDNESLASCYVKLVDIEGTDEVDAFTEKDETQVREAIIQIAINLEADLRAARELKDILQNKLICTWEETAKTFLAGIGKPLRHETAPPENEFVGKWTAYYIEGSMGAVPKIVEENITLLYADGKLNGVSDYENPNFERQETFYNMEVFDRMLNGASTVEGWKPPNGFSRFQLVSNYEGNVLDGVVSWVGGLTKQIDWSRYIWVKQGFNHSEVTDFVKKEMEIERNVYNNRIRERYDFYQQK